MWNFGIFSLCYITLFFFIFYYFIFCHSVQATANKWSQLLWKTLELAAHTIAKVTPKVLYHITKVMTLEIYERESSMCSRIIYKKKKYKNEFLCRFVVRVLCTSMPWNWSIVCYKCTLCVWVYVFRWIISITADAAVHCASGFMQNTSFFLTCFLLLVFLSFSFCFFLFFFFGTYFLE